MAITIKIHGLNDIRDFGYKLDNKKIEKSLMKGIKMNMTLMQKKMKLRAQSGQSTGNLAKSITLKSKKNGFILDIGAYYGIFQILGYKPHVIPNVYMQQHMANPNIRQPKKSASKSDIKKYGGFTKVKWKQSDDFFTPVFKEQVAKIDEDVATELEKHLARGK